MRCDVILVYTHICWHQCAKRYHIISINILARSPRAVILCADMRPPQMYAAAARKFPAARSVRYIHCGDDMLDVIV